MRILQLEDLTDGQKVKILFNGKDEYDATYHYFENSHSFAWSYGGAIKTIGTIVVQPEHAITIVEIFGEVVVEYNENK